MLETLTRIKDTIIVLYKKIEYWVFLIAFCWVAYNLIHTIFIWYNTGFWPETFVNNKEKMINNNSFSQITLNSEEGFDLDALNSLLGQYATQSQVQETVRTGPSTFEQAKGLYPYLDDRLVRLFLNKYAESGNERLALAEMRADPIMVEIYPGIKPSITYLPNFVL